MYQVFWDDEVYSEVASTWLDTRERLTVIDAVHAIDQVLMQDPTNAGTALPEGLFWLDHAPVRAIYSIDEVARRVQVHRIRKLSSKR